MRPPRLRLPLVPPSTQADGDSRVNGWGWAALWGAAYVLFVVFACRFVHRAGGRPCMCGHRHVYHQHYRPGTDCTECSCPTFRTYKPRPGGEPPRRPQGKCSPPAGPDAKRVRDAMDRAVAVAIDDMLREIDDYLRRTP